MVTVFTFTDKTFILRVLDTDNLNGHTKLSTQTASKYTLLPQYMLPEPFYSDYIRLSISSYSLNIFFEFINLIERI